jgi:uncharacterized protein YabE (DUF348 family)/3D (Asp-Asp-Asp) domain-containing protein
MFQKMKESMTKTLSLFKRGRVLSTIAAVLVLTLTVTVVVASAYASYEVTIQDNGTTIVINTRKDIPEDILAQADIPLGEHDLLDSTAFIAGESSVLTVYRACEVKLADKGKTTALVGLKSVGFTLEYNDITLNAKDFISVPLDSPVYEGLVISLDRAFDVRITADKETITLHTQPFGTVADALKQAGITLGVTDETVPALSESLYADMTIEVLRVEYADRTVEKSVAYERTSKRSNTLYVGESKVTQRGVRGKKEITYRDRIVNGKLEETTVLSEKLLREPVPKITLVGTKIRDTKIVFKSGVSPISTMKPKVDLKLDENGLPTQYKSIIEGTAKAYTAPPGAKTATGRPAQVGHIAVNPKQIPYGTSLYVVSLDGRYIYGYCIAADTGGFVKKNSCTIDIYMNTVDECYQWGHRGVRIYVLD